MEAIKENRSKAKKKIGMFVAVAGVMGVNDVLIISGLIAFGLIPLMCFAKTR